jgi:hypothetical protein
MSALPRLSDVNLLRYGESIVHFNSQITDGAFDFAMAERS